MIEFTVLIPVLSNTGEAFTPDHDSVFEAFLLSRLGGFSRLPGLVAGGWIGDGGFVYHDASRLYVVSLDSVFESSKVLEVVRFALVHYDQEAIHVRYLGLSETIKK